MESTDRIGRWLSAPVGRPPTAPASPPHAAKPTEVVGFVSINGEAGVKRLAGLPVVGYLENLDALVEHHRINQVVVAGGGSTLARRVLDVCMNVDVALRILPEMEDILTGESTERRCTGP